MEEKTHIKMLTNKTDIMYKTTGMSIFEIYSKKKILHSCIPTMTKKLKPRDQ